MKKVIILYRELASYVLYGLDELANRGVQVDIIAYPINSEAPFQLSYPKGVNRLERSSFQSAAELSSFIANGNYQLIICGGWADKMYLQAVKLNRNIPAVIIFDKQWLGGFKDHLKARLLNLFVTKSFDFAWVPGEEQKVFAKAMGFTAEQIKEGLYICETDRFSRVYEKRIHRNGEVRKWYYVGRYAPEKNIQVLCEAFAAWVSSENRKDELHCFGTGPLFDSRIQHPQIIHHGFKQPAEMEQAMGDGDIFILPSLYEPWGVVVNEFAVAGYPLILSDKVGARTALLTEKNGWLLENNTSNGVVELLQKVSKSTDQELKSMGEISRSLGLKLDAKQYADSILSMMKS
jgi:glycosyltransferase involved in cell wall biosynthesis